MHYLSLEELLHELPEPAMFGDRALLDGALQWSGHPGKLTENWPTYNKSTSGPPFRSSSEVNYKSLAKNLVLRLKIKGIDQ